MGAMNTPLSIRDLQAAQRFAGIYTLENIQLATTKNGGYYLKGLISDQSGKVPFRKWSSSEIEAQLLGSGGFFRIEGQGQDYQGQVQVIVETLDCTPIAPDPEDLKRLVPMTGKDIDRMFVRVTELLQSMEHAGLKSLTQAYLDDQAWMEKFRIAPAASSLHHAFLGGLLEHTVTLMELADRTLKLYPELNRDIVLTGLFLHDLCKCEELSWENGAFSYTTDGMLIGHIGRGVVRLNEKAKQTGLETPVLMVLEHIIFSHHGKAEFGALKTPATPEAVFISQLDDLDAKTRLVLDLVRRDEADAQQADAFTERQWALDGARLWRPDPTKL